ncbi:MAG: DUF763 domain-containing protein [Thermoplasmata archaeon]|nr:MAG: DUF763 domain-containing protein [Thermoplasmata archaeon]
MPQTGYANLPLHGGPAPPWLFKRMVKLARAIVETMVLEYDRKTVLKRLSDPFWFQAFSCVLGFDWHSSGTTTVTCGALKEALDGAEHGLAVAGGKGRTSRKAPAEIEQNAELFNLSTSKGEELKRASRLSAKTDSAALQDGYALYHHVFIMTERGEWAVIQQGLDGESSYARRYHWCYDSVESFVSEPHDAILGERSHDRVLDMTANASEPSRQLCVELVRDSPAKLQNLALELSPLARFEDTIQARLDCWQDPAPQPRAKPAEAKLLHMPLHINWPLMREVYEFQPANYEELLGFKGVGPATVRALALIGELIYGEQPSWRDPVKFSFTVGGKDGVPFPVDRSAMDSSIAILQKGVDEAKLNKNDKLQALQRLRKFVPDDYCG